MFSTAQSHCVYLQSLLVDLLAIVLCQGSILSHRLSLSEPLLFVTLDHMIFNLLVSHGTLVTFLHLLHCILTTIDILLALLVLLHILS